MATGTIPRGRVQGCGAQERCRRGERARRGAEAVGVWSVVEDRDYGRIRDFEICTHPRGRYAPLRAAQDNVDALLILGHGDTVVEHERAERKRVAVHRGRATAVRCGGSLRWRQLVRSGGFEGC
jgi:hypothetical protein